MQTSPDFIDWLVGAFFIVLYSYKRYGGSAAVRTSTTRQRFYGFYLMYLATLLVAYAYLIVALQSFPHLLVKYVPLIGSANLPLKTLLADSSMTAPVLAALMLTVLLPNIKALSALDKRILEFFWDKGQMPVSIANQAERLCRADYHIPAHLKKEIESQAKDLGIRPSDLEFNPTEHANYRWTKLCSIILSIEALYAEKSSNYAHYLKGNREEFEDIRAGFIALSAHAANFFRRWRLFVKQDVRCETHVLLTDLSKHLLTNIARLQKKAVVFLSRAVISSELTENKRSMAFQKMGFDNVPVSDGNLSSSQVFLLSFWLFIGFFIISVMESRSNLSMLALITAMSCAQYGIAVVVTIYAKSVWRFTDIECTRSRPWCGYLLSGLLAATVGLFCVLSIRYLSNAINGKYLLQNWQSIGEDLSRHVNYLLQSLVLGGVLSYLADSYSNVRGDALKQYRWTDALTLSLAMLVASCGTYYLKYSSGYTGDFFYFVAKGYLIGFIIGFTVPHWYRLNKSRTPTQRLDRMVHREKDAILIEVNRLKPGELREALLVGGALTANADGKIDRIEIEVMKKFLSKLIELNIDDFSVAEEITRFERYLSELATGIKYETYQNHSAIRNLIGRGQLPEILVQLCLAIAYSNGKLKEQEKSVIARIAANLNLNPTLFDRHLAYGSK